MSKSNLIDAYGTPISHSAISQLSQLDDDLSFDLIEEPTIEQPIQKQKEKTESDFTPRISPRLTIGAKKTSVRFGIRSNSSLSTDFKIIRIWHPDNLFKTLNNSELKTITSFKSIRIVPSTKLDQVVKAVSAKLVINEPGNFALFAISNQCMHTPIYLFNFLDYKLFN